MPDDLPCFQRLFHIDDPLVLRTAECQCHAVELLDKLAVHENVDQSSASHPYTRISPGSHREALYRKDNRYSTRYFSSGISHALSLRTGEVPAGSPAQRVLHQEAISPSTKSGSSAFNNISSVSSVNGFPYPKSHATSLKQFLQ